MFHFFTFIKLVFVLFVICAVLFVVTTFSGPIREKTGGVLGIQTVQKQTEALPQQLQEDVTNSLEDAKEKGMDVKVEDVVSFASRTQKIIHDYQNLQKEITKQADTFFKERTTEKKEAKQTKE